jgi:hypothetical protein
VIIRCVHPVIIITTVPYREDRATPYQWDFVFVYGAAQEEDKEAFLVELGEAEVIRGCPC